MAARIFSIGTPLTTGARTGVHWVPPESVLLSETVDPASQASRTAQSDADNARGRRNNDVSVMHCGMCREAESFRRLGLHDQGTKGGGLLTEQRCRGPTGNPGGIRLSFHRSPDHCAVSEQKERICECGMIRATGLAKERLKVVSQSLLERPGRPVHRVVRITEFGG